MVNTYTKLLNTLREITSSVSRFLASVIPEVRPPSSLISTTSIVDPVPPA